EAEQVDQRQGHGSRAERQGMTLRGIKGSQLAQREGSQGGDVASDIVTEAGPCSPQPGWEQLGEVDGEAAEDAPDAEAQERHHPVTAAPAGEWAEDKDCPPGAERVGGGEGGAPADAG